VVLSPLRIDKRIYRVHTKYMHTTTAQNIAHRNDLTWNKTARSEYIRFDGLTIRKNETGLWNVLLPTGENVAAANTGGYRPTYPLSGHSLTYTKWMVEHYGISADSAPVTA
jgi:hypothetical protein